LTRPGATFEEASPDLSRSKTGCKQD
jgi:hypothetical protein